MTSSRNDDLLDRVQAIRVNSRHGRRSPHKPLLLLLSIGRHFNGHERLNQSQGGNYILQRWQRHGRCKHRCVGSGL